MRYCVISHNRPDNVKPLEELCNQKFWWYVGKGEKYDSDQVVRAGGLVQSRNRALADAFRAKEPCLMMDDDVKTFSKTTDKKTIQSMTFHETVTEMRDTLKMTPYKMAGVSPTNNPFYTQHKIGTHKFVIASMILVNPTPLRFDSMFRTKEDYDYTLQHIKKYGGICRCDWLIPKFGHYTNAGGVVEYRTADMEQQSIARLKTKWGKVIRDNPKRPNEVLIKL